MNQAINQIIKFSKSFEDADFSKSILGKHYDEVLNNNIPVVLFGTGDEGILLSHALKLHKVNIACFCNSTSKVSEKICSDFPVISIDELLLSRFNYQKKMLVIPTSKENAERIHKVLADRSFPVEMIQVPDIDRLLFYVNRVTQHWWNIKDFQIFEQEIQKVFDLLSDKKSKDIFIHRIALFYGAFDYKSYKNFIDNYADLLSDTDNNYFLNQRYDENYFYFNSDFLAIKNDEVFANVGALIGDCACEFAKACAVKSINYKEIINFEPDPNNFRQLLLNTNHLSNVRCFNYGIWSHKSRLRFNNPNPSHAGTVGTLDKNGNLEVDVISLDELLPDSEISLIKMDIEGAEIEALKGARNTIIKNKPKLIISVYHKRNDIFEIPMLVHQLYSGYKFYLRHHSTTFSETVLYAIPS